MRRKDVLEILNQELIDRIDRIACDKDSVFLFGANGFAESVINFLYENGILVCAVLDNDCNKQGGRVFDIPIVAPEYIQDKKTAVILILSNYCNEMIKQIIDINSNLKDKICIIDNLKDFNNSLLKKNHYWEEETFKNEMLKLNQGKEVYEKLKKKHDGTMMVSPTISIGDNFLWELSFVQYKKIYGLEDYFIVVPSMGAYKAVKLYGEKNICIISVSDMNILIKFIMFLGEDCTDSLLIYPRHNNQRCFDSVLAFKGMGWHSMYKNGIFQLPSNTKFSFPDIKEKNFDEEKLKAKGVIKGKSVILSPYANTVNELPIWFWEKLTSKLIQNDYVVFTNIVGKQKKIKGTYEIEIPLTELGNYLEYSGTFISLRNGLCDIAGKAKCNQIVIYRDELTLHMPKVLFNDLRLDEISPYSKSLIWFERDIDFNVERVMDYIK